MARERALLVLVSRKGGDKEKIAENFREMRELVRSANGEVITEITAPLFKPQAHSYIGEGKVVEIASLALAKKPNLVIFNVNLSPTQARNIEDSCGGIRVVDRTGLILDIFAQRARSKEGRLQVELAQLSYLLPRLAGYAPELSRLGGGIGTRGPGEMKLEIDRRRIRVRIRKIEEELEKLETHRDLLRSRRRANQLFLISLVGYTNAGKSTLINALTNSDIYAADKLFATLDPTTRILKGKPTVPSILFTDTVGFISELPHELVKAFHATLEEVVEADLLIHVVDASNPQCEDQRKVVDDILKDLGCEKKNVFLVFNKKDLTPAIARASLLSFYPQGFMVSALKREGLEELKEEILKLAQEKMRKLLPENEDPDPDSR